MPTRIATALARGTAREATAQLSDEVLLEAGHVA